LFHSVSSAQSKLAAKTAHRMAERAALPGAFARKGGEMRAGKLAIALLLLCVTLGAPAGKAVAAQLQSTAAQSAQLPQPDRPVNTGPVSGQVLIATDAPPPGMPAEVAAALRDIGPKVEGARTAALYAPLHADIRHDAVELKRDQAYGPDARHRADVFVQKGAQGTRRPLLAFFYGGGFRGGNKSADNSPFYQNIGYWAAEHGLVGVTFNYRLAPQVTWPAGAEDVERAVTWLREHAAEWGADPDQIFLWGHSSGAAHVADYLARTPRAPVAGAILMSGIYSPTAMWSVYYGEDATQYPQRASLPRLVQLRLPLFAVWAELDPPDFIPDTTQLVERRRAADLPTISLELPNHSHLSEAYAIGTADESLATPLLQFIRSPPR